MSEIAKASGVHGATLSRIERGSMLPDDEIVPQLEEAYGAQVHTWYPPLVWALMALGRDEEAG